MGIKINFADVESSFQPLPEGPYDVVIEGVEVRESKSSDNDYLSWELKVLDPEFEGRRLWAITSLGPKALWKLKDTLLALDIIDADDEIELEWEDGIDITPQEGPRVTSPEVEGLACVAIVKNRMYEGKERNSVDELHAAGSDVQKAAPAKAAGRPAKGRAGRTKLR